jgi:DNA-binding LacI/PurR family transcriptional regulator
MTSTIGIICAEEDPGFFAERYFREILTVASQTIAGHDCYIRIISLTLAQAASPAATHALLMAQGVHAALGIAPNQPFLALLEALFRDIPGIVISAPRLDTSLSYVNSDNYGALRQIVEHLAGLGRRRIRLLQPADPSGDFLERARGYADVVAALGLEPLVGAIDYPINDAVIDQQVLAYAPDALIAPDDSDALGLLSRLQRRGLRVPDDIALVGFDDEDFAADTFPALTTVSQPLADMSRHAVGYLLDRLAGVEREVYQEVLPNRLIVRESCGARRSKTRDW